MIVFYRTLCIFVVLAVLSINFLLVVFEYLKIVLFSFRRSHVVKSDRFGQLATEWAQQTR